MKRFVLFFITNMAIMLVFSMVMFFANIQFSNLVNLAIMSGIIGFSGSVISLLLSKYIALFSVNGKILKHGKNEVENWLLQTVCDQSTRLGIVAPEVAIYYASDMNAFATGARRDSSLIAVSTGLLSNMNRDEVEAVIAHEMSHILNGDMVTITLIQGIINTFVIFISRVLGYCISHSIAYLLSSNESESDENANHSFSESSSFVYFFISIILELIFGILANMIVLWFSRRREFYADSGSAKLVGCDKMISALEKLKCSSVPQESKAILSFCIHGDSVSDSVSKMLSNWFMSHPPLDDRIEALRNGYYL